jgi:putative ATP-binding cassette transporter
VFVRRLWRLTKPYWTSADAPKGGALLGSAIALELGTVYASVVLSQWQRQIFDELQTKAMESFFRTVGIFFAVALGFVLVSAYRIYVRAVLQIRWRRWLTDHLLERWMDTQAYCEIELNRKSTDNPDQRIAEDVNNYVASALGLSLSLLSSLVTLVSFSGILWALSGAWDLKLGKLEFQIPGFMMWVALVYAGAATWLTHRVGHRLVPINFDQQRFEADFRFHLVRFRENVGEVAVSRGETREREGALDRFHHVVDNFGRLIRAQRNLTLVTTGLGQTNSMVPILVAAPGFFLGRLTLGDVMQVNIAYGQVSGALVWFVNAYQEIAQWRASIERLYLFTAEIEETCQDLRSAHVRVEESPDPALELRDLHLELPDGRVIVDGVNARVAPGERVVVVGPSGSGKSSLIKAIAGIWPFGHGRIEMPARGKKLFLPQRPYLPIGTLRAAVSYPSEERAFPDERIREALVALGLDRLSGRLDEEAHWNQMLSGGEQQRIALARVLLHEPDWIFLDEATSGLDEQMEERAYALLAERLPKAAVVSIAHRKSLIEHHQRRWTLVPRDGAMTLEAA